MTTPPPRRRSPSVLSTYRRTVALLGSETRLAGILVLGNVGLAVAAFAEPVLFGQIIDRLTRGGPAGLRCRVAERDDTGPGAVHVHHRARRIGGAERGSEHCAQARAPEGKG